MELSDTTLAHLRDEAYADLAREALLARLGQLKTERATVVSTRPPFGVLARRSTREAFARTMRTVDDNEQVLRDQLAEITGIVDWLRPFIRRDVSAYLAGESPDYCQLLQLAARMDDWEQAYRRVPELLTAFARDLRAVRLALTPEKGSHALFAHELAVLRESAERLTAQRHELDVIAQAARALVPAGTKPEPGFPDLSHLQRLPWVSRLAVLPPEKALAEVTQAEAGIRALVGGPDHATFARLQQNRARCAELSDGLLEHYWHQLRAHARAHYVEEREVHDVIRMLSETYVDAELRRRQQAVSVDPFVPRR